MDLATNRRDVAKSAALLGVGALAGAQLAAETEAASSGSSPPAPSSATSPAPSSSGNAPVPLAPPDAQPPSLKVPEAVARQAGWAIVGLGQLALEEVIPA